MTIEEQRKILRNIKKLRDLRGYDQSHMGPSNWESCKIHTAK